MNAYRFLLARLFARPRTARRCPTRLDVLRMEDRLAPAAAVFTDQTDYPFGATAAITGSGFTPFDTVTLQVTHAAGTPGSNEDAQNQPFQVTADADGAISASWVVDDPDAVGATYILSAADTHGETASTTFTDAPRVGAVTVSSQSLPLTYGTGGSTTYTVTVTRGTGPGSAGNFTANLSLVGPLPAGTTFSFASSSLPFAPAVSTLSTTLTLTTTGAPVGPALTPAGSFGFGVRATAANPPSGVDNATGGGMLVVNQRAVSPEVTAADKVYDGTTAATLTDRSLTNALAGDAVSLVGGTATFSDKNVGTDKTVTATGLSLSGAAAGNYLLTTDTATTTASISPLAVTGSVTVADKVYDATTAATITSRTLTGTIPGDDVSYVGGTATFSDPNAGTGKTVTATGLSLAGADAGNYTVNDTATTTATITPKALSVTAATQATINIGENGSIQFRVQVTGGIVDGKSVAELFNGASFTLSVKKFDGSVVYGSVTAAARVDADGSIVVSLRMNDTFRLLLKQAFDSGRAVDIGLTAVSFGGNYTVSTDVFAKLLNNGRFAV